MVLKILIVKDRFIAYSFVFRVKNSPYNGSEVYIMWKFVKKHSAKIIIGLVIGVITLGLYYKFKRK